MDRILWKFGPFLLSLDITAYTVWLMYYCITLLVEDTNINLSIYREYHYTLTVHLIATLRLIYIVATDYYCYVSKKSKCEPSTEGPGFWLSFGALTFAFVYDILNVVYVFRILPDTMTDIYDWEFALSWVFLGLSASIYCWYIMRKIWSVCCNTTTAKIITVQTKSMSSRLIY